MLRPAGLGRRILGDHDKPRHATQARRDGFVPGIEPVRFDHDAHAVVDAAVVEGGVVVVVSARRIQVGPASVPKLRGEHHVERAPGGGGEAFVRGGVVQRQEEADRRLALIVVEAHGLVAQIGKVDRVVPTAVFVLTTDERIGRLAGGGERLRVTRREVGAQVGLTDGRRARRLHLDGVGILGALAPTLGQVRRHRVNVAAVRVDGLKKRDAFRERGLGPRTDVGGEETYGQQGQEKPAGRAHGGG